MRTKLLEIVKYKQGSQSHVWDELAVESLLEVYVNNIFYALITRMPGEDLDLVRGLCYSNGLISDISEINCIKQYLGQEGRDRVSVEIVRVLEKQSSACGTNSQSQPRPGSFAEKTSGKITPPKSEKDLSVLDKESLLQLKENFEQHMQIFPRTGFTHAAAVYSYTGELLAFAEDVGRHNAVDKILGKVLVNKQKQQIFVAMASSRLSFEMLQKVAYLLPEICAGFSAVSSLAVQSARDLNMTVVGFLRNARMNIYSMPERLSGS